MKLNFAKRGDRIIKRQEFDREKMTTTKGGQTYNTYDAIQAANVDTDIKEVLKKFHCSVDEGIEFMERKGGMKGIYGEFAELQEKCQNFADIMQLKQKADELFYNLPVEVREKYGHNLNDFFKDLEKNAKKEKPEPQKAKKEVTENVQ